MAAGWERSRRISRATVEALSELRERGTRLGRPRRCPDDVLALVVASRDAGARLAGICDRLNAAGIPTPGGSTRWYPSHVSRLLRTQDAVAARTDSLRQDDQMPYGYIASMRTKPGHRDEVVAILLSGAEGLRAFGCQLYVVGVSATDDVTIWVNEVWQTKEHHDASLQLPETRAAIAKAMPMLTGEFTGQETTVAGGLGL